MGRSDGRKLKNLDVEYLVAAHVMAERTDAMNMITIDAPLEPIKRYLNEKRREGKRYSHLCVVMAAMIRTFSQFPELNRFVVNKRIYARNELAFGMVVLKGGSIHNPGTTSKMKFDPASTIDDVNNVIEAYIEKNRDEADVNATDKLASFLCSVPGLLRVAVSVVKWLDKHNWCPKAIIEASPFHCSLMFTNLASIKTGHIYHHTYNFGTVSLGMAMGQFIDKPVKKGGEITTQRFIPFGLVMDERIASGAYFALAFRQFSHYLEHPELLELPPEEVKTDLL